MESDSIPEISLKFDSVKVATKSIKHKVKWTLEGLFRCAECNNEAEIRLHKELLYYLCNQCLSKRTAKQRIKKLR